VAKAPGPPWEHDIEVLRDEMLDRDRDLLRVLIRLLQVVEALADQVPTAGNLADRLRRVTVDLEALQS